MIVVLDESVDFGILPILNKYHIKYYSIAKSNSGISDVEVLKIAFEKDALLLTEDKDFGELTYRLQLKHRGILLIRLSDIKRNNRFEIIENILANHFNKLRGTFSVLNKNGLRIKK